MDGREQRRRGIADFTSFQITYNRSRTNRSISDLSPSLRQTGECDGGGGACSTRRMKVSLIVFIVAPFGLTMLLDFGEIERPKSTERSHSLVRPRGRAGNLPKDIPGCLPSSRHIDTPFHFFDTITAPAGPSYVRPSNVTNAHLYCGSNTANSARVRASIRSVCAACLHRLQLLDDNHPCVYLLSSPATSHSHILQSIPHTIRIIGKTTTTKTRKTLIINLSDYIIFQLNHIALILKLEYLTRDYNQFHFTLYQAPSRKVW